MSDHPRITVVMATLNAEKYVQESVDSVMSQTCESWELLVMDGLSTDRTTDIVRGYNSPRIRLCEQADEGVAHAWDRAIDIARGDYVLFLCASDVYINNSWFEECLQAMDADPEVSLVWGPPAVAHEDGDDIQVYGMHPDMIESTQKRQWLTLWLTTGRLFPDPTMCIDRRVLRSCMPAYRPGSRVIDAIYAFNYTFNRHGYLPLGLSCAASFSRQHEGMLSMNVDRVKERRWSIVDYARRTRRYRQSLLRGSETHIFRDRRGEPLEEFKGLAGIPESHFRTRIASGERLDLLAGTNLADQAYMHGKRDVTEG